MCLLIRKKHRDKARALQQEAQANAEPQQKQYIRLVKKLHQLVRNREEEAIKQLISDGADVNGLDDVVCICIHKLDAEYTLFLGP